MLYIELQVHCIRYLHRNRSHGHAQAHVAFPYQQVDKHVLVVKCMIDCVNVPKTCTATWKILKNLYI
ncbi:hypothetical protein DUNSADRAFT_1046 [Dunaliella salina]|uniref:Encoded protein n=1 Tax=Dunaliella salina TaxID=3046 RepID=A0ABQ7GXM0_DUNSA|nr:hypothetical protein DUNSADRAFT_1046 [Dunaliella salina]|eukprot:KAF5839362.1 hypothetical protein DUNSADRAFT_1046 [Dunaliella salina]